MDPKTRKSSNDKMKELNKLCKTSRRNLILETFSKKLFIENLLVKVQNLKNGGNLKKERETKLAILLSSNKIG